MNHEQASAAALFDQGNRLMAAGDLPGAEGSFRRAVALAPGLAEAHANLGLVLDRAGRVGEAEECYRQAVSLKPDLGAAYMNLGGLLTRQKRLEEAEDACRHAVDLLPASPVAWSNLGVLHACRKQERKAELNYRVAMDLDPEYRPAQFNLSYLLLRQGRFEEGWRRLEARDWYAQLEQRIPCPRWRGEPLPGRSLLIAFEAGHGDMIQFSRYAAVLKAQGAARIDLICHPALKTLFATLDTVASAIGFDEPLLPESSDFWTPPLSIPFHCLTRLETIPADIPYLRADPARAARWSAALAALCAPADLRVGLVWKGSRNFENDADRSLPGLETLEPLGTITGVRFFGLQKGAGEDQAAHPPPGLPLIDLAPQIVDFADTAAIVANLDLVVSVDTAVAHLAGALGKACWVLLPDYKTDWRWLTGRSDSPWYPGVMRLFRQQWMGDWEGVVGEVGVALRELAAGRREGSRERLGSECGGA